MIVYDFDILCIHAIPDEADAQLVVNANAPLAFSVSLQLLQPIPRRDTKSLNIRSGSNHVKLAQRNSSDRCKPTIVANLVQLLGVLALE